MSLDSQERVQSAVQRGVRILRTAARQILHRKREVRHGAGVLSTVRRMPSLPVHLTKCATNVLSDEWNVQVSGVQQVLWFCVGAHGRDHGAGTVVYRRRQML